MSVQPGTPSGARAAKAPNDPAGEAKGTSDPISSPRRVYLSGGMEYADGEGRDWRAEIQQWCQSELGWSVFNPNLESDRFFSQYYPEIDFRALKLRDIDRYREIVARLVDIDCREIATRSDLVICFWDASAMRGAGTKGELTIARFTGKPVYLVTAMPLADIPGWVLGCTTSTFPTFAALREYLRTLDHA